MTSINHLFRRSISPQRVNDAGYIIPATTAVMIHAVYRYPFNEGMAPKPQARHIAVVKAVSLYTSGICKRIPISKNISDIATATKNNWDIFFIWIFALQVAGYRLQVTGCRALKQMTK